MTVYILQGIPGSGKSTFANSLPHAPVMPFGDSLPVPVICSADDHFMVDGKYWFDSNKLGEAHQSCFRKFLKLVQDPHMGYVQSPVKSHDQCCTIVVDNTNITRVDMAPYVLAAQSFGHTIEFHTFIVDPEVAFKRGTHGVPLKVIQEKARIMQPPIKWWGKHIIHNELSKELQNV